MLAGYQRPAQQIIVQSNCRFQETLDALEVELVSQSVLLVRIGSYNIICRSSVFITNFTIPLLSKVGFPMCLLIAVMTPS